VKLAAIYNVWDGEELLAGSMKQIQEHVDSFILVWQERSNFDEVNPDIRSYMESLQGGKVQIIEYVPNPNLSGTVNERNKRRFGFDIAKQTGHTHFIFMDCDEYYHAHQFEAAKKYVIANDLDTSACNMYTYYKHPTYQITPPESYFVPFICKTNAQAVGSTFPVNVDPTRGVAPSGNFKRIDKSMCMMHHYSYIRKNIQRKLENSSAKVNWHSQIPSMVNEYNNYQLGQPMMRFNGTTKLVDNYFSIFE